MSKKCSSCGAELPDNAKFCDKCGATVQETPNQKIYCPNCGFENESGVKFCVKCGTPTASEGVNQHAMSYAPEAKKKRRWPWIVGICILIFIILGIIGSGTDPVEGVKKGCLTQYSSTITVEEAFENRFDNCEWSSSESNINEGAYNIYFSGDDTAMGTHWEVIFYSQDDWFEIDSITIDGDMQYDDTVIYYLMSYVYTGNLNQLYTDLGTALWDAMLSY